MLRRKRAGGVRETTADSQYLRILLEPLRYVHARLVSNRALPRLVPAKGDVARNLVFVHKIPIAPVNPELAVVRCTVNNDVGVVVVVDH